MLSLGVREAGQETPTIDDVIARARSEGYELDTGARKALVSVGGRVFMRLFRGTNDIEFGRHSVNGYLKNCPPDIAFTTLFDLAAHYDGYAVFKNIRNQRQIILKAFVPVDAIYFSTMNSYSCMNFEEFAKSGHFFHVRHKDPELEYRAVFQVPIAWIAGHYLMDPQQMSKSDYIIYAAGRLQKPRGRPVGFIPNEKFDWRFVPEQKPLTDFGED